MATMLPLAHLPHIGLSASAFSAAAANDPSWHNLRTETSMIPVWGYIGAGALALGFLGGWTARDWKADSDQLSAQNKAQEAYRASAERLAEQSGRYDALVQTLRLGERSDRTTIREIYRNVEVPGECVVPEPVVSLLNNAVDRANAAATGQPD